MFPVAGFILGVINVLIGCRCSTRRPQLRGGAIDIRNTSAH